MNILFKLLISCLIFGGINGYTSINGAFFTVSKKSNELVNKQLTIGTKKDDTNLLSGGITIRAKESFKVVNQEEIFNAFAGFYGAEIPTSYSYIGLKITGTLPGSQLHSSLQKLVYLDILPNQAFRISANKNLSALGFYKLAEKLFNINFIESSEVQSLHSRKATTNDIEVVKKILLKNLNTNLNTIQGPEESTSGLLGSKQKIFMDVYDTLVSKHYDKNTFNQSELISGAIKGLAEGTGDNFTTYFPPVENKSFQESLEGKFEGIGSYVEMEKPGILKIISPISGSPSERAGLKGGDIITHADGKEILPTTSLKEAISWIKGPKGTQVVLSVKRGREKLKISVTRDTIVIKNVEYKKLNSSTFYIKLVSFGEEISSEFDEALGVLKSNTGIRKVIIDLRNNPGGYLGEVSDMLSHFVPKGEETVIVKHLSGAKNYYSTGKTLINFGKYRLIILQNEGSASASEIMAGTIKDYLPKTTIIGTKSYGKGSVQTIKPYSDGSSLKYTIAKWFTGKTATGIDGIGIPVDIKLEFDFDKFKKLNIDNQLEKAKSIR